MVQTANTIVITLGTVNSGGTNLATQATNTTMSWTPSATATDWATHAVGTARRDRDDPGRPRVLMRPIATLVVSLAMSLSAIGLAVAAPGGLGGRQELARVEVQAASGAVSISNSRAGQAVFNAAAMRPGEGVSGTVTIGNDGNHPGRFAVQAAGVAGRAGPERRAAVRARPARALRRHERPAPGHDLRRRPGGLRAGRPRRHHAGEGARLPVRRHAARRRRERRRQPLPGRRAQPRLPVVGGQHPEHAHSHADAPGCDPDARSGDAARRRPPPPPCRSRSPTSSACPRSRAASRRAR